MKLTIIADTDIAQAMREVQPGKGKQEVMRRAVELAEQREQGAKAPKREKPCTSKSNAGALAR